MLMCNTITVVTGSLVGDIMGREKKSQTFCRDQGFSSSQYQKERVGWGYLLHDRKRKISF